MNPDDTQISLASMNSDQQIAWALAQITQLTTQHQNAQIAFQQTIRHQNDQFNALLASMNRSPIPSSSPADTPGSLNVQLATFQGRSSESVSTWIFQIEEAFKAKGIGENRKVAFAASSLRDAALQWYQNWVTAANNPASGLAPIRTFDDFKSAITTAFQPPNYQFVLYRQLKELKQTGTIYDYVYAFRNLMGQVQDMGELDRITYFIEGLRTETKREINYQAPKNLEAAIAGAVTFDSAMFGVNSPFTTIPPRVSSNGHSSPAPLSFPASSPQDQPAYGSSQMVPMELDANAVLSEQRKMEYRRKGLCFRCGRKGHLSRNCPAKEQGNDRGL